jgi:hypothetical protein
VAPLSGLLKKRKVFTAPPFIPHLWRGIRLLRWRIVRVISRLAELLSSLPSRKTKKAFVNFLNIILNRGVGGIDFVDSDFVKPGRDFERVSTKN